MAKKSIKSRENNRRKLYEKYKKKRKILKESGDYESLQKLPRNSSPTRLHNRCNITGRGRGYIRKFGISRISFREFASFGLIPGLKKSSW